MIEWNKICIKDICTKICSGGTPKSTIREYYYNGTIPWLNTGEIHFNRIYQTKNKITELGFKNSSAKWIEANSVIIALYGETAGKVALTRIPLTTNQACCNLTLDSSIADPNFVYYSFLNSYSRLLHLKNGGAQQNISVQIIKEFDILLPPLETQKKIAAVLSSLDDKIELNTRMNKVLEEIAQVIFKRWFVEFEFPNEKGEPYRSSGGKMKESELGLIPEGWGVKMLGEVAKITMGQSPNGTSYNENEQGSVFYQGRGEFGTRFPTRRLFTTEPKRFAEAGDILLSVRAPVGDINVAIEKCCIGRGLASLQSTNNCPSFLYYALNGIKKDFEVYNGDGTVFGSINSASLKKMRLVIPESNVMGVFEKMVCQLDYKIKMNFMENERLAKVRDTLLPKLMSGDIGLVDEIKT